MKQVVVGLGANLGAGRKTLQAAARALRGAYPDGFAASPLYRSAPQHCPPGSPPFWNAVVRFAVPDALAPEALLDALLALEQAHGRARSAPNAPRTLDLDLLFFGEERIASPRLTVPHPRALDRDFVLGPLAALDPERRWPRTEHRVADLWAAFPGPRTLKLVADQWC
ncbi:MAG: 2-amino-4-hydroxy-6-hydroxymethyldihydropteridine diphosphokinase [Pseudomonadales bacterium]|nr:2-amino-4-hydroxy-6-hydroxymethyldihydropteridine diphosphokinase [Pseudomonadales bacterium]